MTDEHKEQLNRWLRSTSAVRGTLVRTIRFPDNTFVSEGAAEEFPVNALEQAWRVMDDTFQVLAAQRFPPQRLSWFYDRAVLHCAQRADGAMLGVFSLRKSSDVDGEGLNRFLNEFQTLALANPMDRGPAQ